VVNWVSACLSFFFCASNAATYIFTAFTYTITIISLESCALNSEFQFFLPSCSISYWDLINWNKAQRQGYFTDDWYKF
jgi:hypothetical protein